MAEHERGWRVTRRNALLGGLAVAAAAAASVGFLYQPQSLPRRLAVHATSSIASARAIGRAYLKAQAHEAHGETLVAAVLGRLELDDRGIARLDDRALEDRLRNLVADDFAIGDTVLLEGWVLSRTEARLCALAAVSL